MEPILTELIKFGIAGVVAFVFYKMWQDEKKEHAETRAALIASLTDRVNDSKENMKNVTVPLDNIAQGMKLISDKIEISKGKQ